MGKTPSIATTMSGFVIGVTSTDPDWSWSACSMLNTRWTGPDPVPELAGTPVRIAAAVTDAAGSGLPSPENTAVIGLD